MSKLNTAAREFKNPRRVLLRWPTRGELPASLVGFHRPADPRERVVQGAFSATINLRGKGRLPAEAHNLSPVGSTPAPATKP